MRRSSISGKKIQIGERFRELVSDDEFITKFKASIVVIVIYAIFYACLVYNVNSFSPTHTVSQLNDDPYGYLFVRYSIFLSNICWVPVVACFVSLVFLWWSFVIKRIGKGE